MVDGQSKHAERPHGDERVRHGGRTYPATMSVSLSHMARSVSVSAPAVRCWYASFSRPITTVAHSPLSFIGRESLLGISPGQRVLTVSVEK
jgi:hypothetical protein